MIAKMLKYRFLVFHREVDEMVDLLRETGVVHVRRSVKDVDPVLKDLLREKAIWEAQLKAYFKILEGLEASRTKDSGLSEDLYSLQGVVDLIYEYTELEKKIPALKEELFHMRRFGDFKNELLEEINESGVYFHLYSVSKGKIEDQWQKEYILEELFDSPRKTYFAIINENPEPPSIKAQLEVFPEQSAEELRQQIDLLKNRKKEMGEWFVNHQKGLRHFLKEHIDQYNAHISQLKLNKQLVKLGGGKVFMLTGWVPEDLSEDIDKKLASEDIYYRKSEPDPSDKPPILLKNKSLGRWFEPITELFSFPFYQELDLTPYFAPFFLLFFGLCLGDGGYGLLLFIVLLLLKKKVPKRYLPIWKLALALEFVAFFAGLLSGTFLGINLLETDVPLLVDLRGFMLDPNGLFTLALILGGIQILFGLILRIVNRTRQAGWQHAIAPLGWIILLTGLTVGYLQGFNTLWTWVSWAGVGAILLWSSPGDKFFIRIGKGIWELYGISGFFGDLLSYIRLFALGLAGSILGFVVNDIAMTIFDTHTVLGPVFGVLMLIIGHGLNIFIATLGAFVHPMRLTFVEFYKNAGFTGGGEAYKPIQPLTLKSKEL